MRFTSLALIATLFATPALSQSCGGNFGAFVKNLQSEAISRGVPAATVKAFFAGTKKDPKVLQADRAQGVFQRPFLDFSRRLISKQRLNKGRQMGRRYDAIFDQVERQYGVNRGVLLAFWAFETDYGSFQGNFNTRNALVTLAHDCRRPELFRPQVFSAIDLFARGQFDPARTTGAWAGEIGMVQMLPADILINGVDGDGDGKVSLKTSAPDALLSGGKMLNHLGWRAGQPWISEVSVPRDLDWSLSGLNTTMSGADWSKRGLRAKSGKISNLPASLILPQGHKGPAFLAYPNFRVYFEWNQSFTYVMTAAYFATRLEGAPVYSAGNPDKGLSGDQMKQLQRKLQKRGHNVGKVDGILGARTRDAVQSEQKRLGLPADAWPTPQLLNSL